MKRCYWLVGALALAAAAGPVTAQMPKQTPQDLVSTQLVLLAKSSLIGQAEPREDQLTRARILLDMAVKLTPDDPDLWLLQAEMAGLNDDPAVRIEAVRQYLKLRPDDDAAQLSLALALVNRQQTVEDKLDVLERFLQAGSSKQLSKPMRSRLAVYAASLAQEQSDTSRFAAWLQLALDLDPANATAAALTYQLVADHDAGPLQLGAAAVALVRAKPLDPETRLALAGTLLGQGVYIRAAEQFQAAATLFQQPIAGQAVHLWAAALAGGSRSDDALALLSQFENFLVMQARAAIAAAEEAGQEPPIDLADVGLPPELELIRLVIHSGGDDPELPQASFDRVREGLLLRAEHSEDEQARQQARLDYLWLGALFGYDLSQIETAIGEQPADDPKVQRAAGWLALQRGERERAVQLLEPLADSGDEVARYGLAVLIEDQPTSRARALQSVVYEFPASVVGLLASRELAATDYDVRPTPVGISLAKLMDKFPDMLWKLDLTSGRWINVRLKVEPGRFSYLEPIPAKITIRNATPLALALGADQTVPTQALITMNPSTHGRASGPLPPSVVQLGRTLTLEPNQSITTDVRLDQTILGMVLRNVPNTTVHLNVTVVFDPRTTDRGFVLGPLGATETVRAISIFGQGVSEPTLDLWLVQASGDDVVLQMKAIARLLSATAQPLPPELDNPETIRRVADVINELFGGFTPLRRAWTAGFLNPQEHDPAAFRRVIDLTERSDDPLVRIMYLATQVREPDAPALISAMRSENTVVRTFAVALQQGIEIEKELEAQAAEQQESQSAPIEPEGP